MNWTSPDSGDHHAGPIATYRRHAQGLIAGALLWPLAAHASPQSHAELVYIKGESASQCPDQTVFARNVATRLGYDPFSRATEAGSPSILRIVAYKTSSGFTATMTIVDATGKVTGDRTFVTDSQDCGELMESIALAASIALDPLRFGASGPNDSPSAPPSSRPKSEPVAPPPSAPVFVSAGLGLDVTHGGTPGWALSPSVWLDVRRGPISLAIEGMTTLPTSVSHREQGSVTASQLGGAILPCVHFDPFVGCGKFGVGALLGSGGEVDAPDSETTPFATAGARLGIQTPIYKQLRLGAHVDASTPLTPTTLELRGETLWETSALVWSSGLTLGVEWR